MKINKLKMIKVKRIKQFFLFCLFVLFCFVLFLFKRAKFTFTNRKFNKQNILIRIAHTTRSK